MVYWERKCVQRNEGAWVAIRKKNIFEPCLYLSFAFTCFIKCRSYFDASVTDNSAVGQKWILAMLWQWFI